MKEIKKWLALLLAVLMAVSLLAACGDAGYVVEDDNDDEDDEKTSATNSDNEEEQESTGELNPGCDDNAGDETATSPSSDVPTTDAPSQPSESEYLKIPTNACTYEELGLNPNIRISMKSDGTVVTVAKQIVSATKTIYYLQANGDELVVECVGDSKTCYAREAGTVSFMNAGSGNAESGIASVEGILIAVTIFGEEHDGMLYQYAGDVSCPTGAAKEYTAYEDNELKGIIQVDVASGITVLMQDADGTENFSVIDINLSSAGIPKYN